MNKTKMILAGIGGAIGLVVLVLAFLVWQAFSAKTAAIEGDDEEGTDGLETVESRAQTLSRKSVYPSAASLKAIAANQEVVDDWCKEGLALASRGDRVYPKTTPAQFKTDLVKDARRLSNLPGLADGKLVKPDFAFGPFKDYIVEGKMPAEAELAELQRKWDDVMTITEMLATNGVSELVDVQFAAAKKDEAGEVKDKRDRGDKRDKRKSPQVTPDDLVSPVAFSYVFTFAARPSAFIRALNDFGSCERFITVDAFTLSHPSDVIADRLGGDEKKQAEQVSGGRRGRRGRRGGEEPSAGKIAGAEEGAEGKNRLVTDPILDAPMTVTVTVTVSDFRSLEGNGENGEAASSPLEKKGNSK